MEGKRRREGGKKEGRKREERGREKKRERDGGRPTSGYSGPYGVLVNNRGREMNGFLGYCFSTDLSSAAFSAWRLP